MPTWPSSLPQELSVQGFQQGARDNVIRSQVDTGPEKTRRRYTAAVAPLRGTMLMTGLQLETLHNFYANEIADGAFSFDFPDIRKPGTISLRFTQPYTWINVGGDFWRVSMQFNIQPSGEAVTGPTAPLYRSYRGSTTSYTHADWRGSILRLNVRSFPDADRRFEYNSIIYRAHEFVGGEHTDHPDEFTICSLIERTPVTVPANYTFDSVALASLALRFRLVVGTDTRFRTASARYSHPTRIDDTRGSGYYCIVGAGDLDFLTQWRMLLAGGETPQLLVELINV